MEKQTWFQELKLRYKQTTPWFFKIVVRIGTVCSTVGGAMVGLSAVPNIQLGLWVVGLGSNLLVAGAVMIAVSKAVVTNRCILPNEQIKDNNGTSDS